MGREKRWSPKSSTEGLRDIFGLRVIVGTYAPVRNCLFSQFKQLCGDWGKERAETNSAFQFGWQTSFPHCPFLLRFLKFHPSLNNVLPYFLGKQEARVLPTPQIHLSSPPSVASHASNWQLSEEFSLVFSINNPKDLRRVIRRGRKKQCDFLTSLLWLLDAKADVTNDATSLLRASVSKSLSRADTGLSILLPVRASE